MNHHDIRANLEQHAERCLELAKKVGPKGGELTTSDKELIRLAYVPAVDEMQGMIKSAFVSGMKEWAGHEMERLEKLIGFLI